MKSSARAPLSGRNRTDKGRTSKTRNRQKAMNENMLPVFFWLMIVAALAWLSLTNRLLGLLKAKHPALYQSLGSPGLFLKKGRGTGLIRFLAGRHYRLQGNPELNRLGDGLLLVCGLFLVNLAGCLLLLLN